MNLKHQSNPAVTAPNVDRGLISWCPSAWWKVLFTTTILFASPLLGAAPALLPFQARLTDSTGAPVADGARLILFQLYSTPTGGNALWAGEMHKTTVNGGLVNVLLGSKVPFLDGGGNPIDFSQTLYLQITVDANGDNQITAADPPLMPRQVVLPTVFAQQAGNSTKLAGNDWSSIVVDGSGVASNNPSSGFLKGSKLAAGSVSTAQIAANSITTGLLQDGQVTASKLAASPIIGTSQIADGAVTLQQLASLIQQSLVPVGTILPFAAATAPPGYLICDGSAVSRSTYPALFAVVTSTWGSGNGSTTFNLPDMRGVFMRGRDAGKGNDIDRSARTALNGAGGNIGDAVGSYQADSFMAHNHSFTVYQTTNEGGGSIRASVTGTGPSSNAAAGSPMTNAGGSETRPKNVNVNYIIKY